MIRFAAAAALLSACAVEPTLAADEEAMSLREALLSPPEVIAALPLEERMGLALRMERALAAQSTRAALADAPTRALIDELDTARLDGSLEAVVAVAVTRDLDTAELSTLEGAGSDAGVEDVPEIALRFEPALSEPPYPGALDGRAREPLLRMAAQTGAREVVLSPSMPAGLVGDAARIEVNPVWLTLLAEVESHDAVGRSHLSLIEPAGHHRTDSDGWGCYSGGCMSGFCGGTCSCGYCGCDCGECAYECGDNSDGIHCATAPPRRRRGNGLDGLGLLLPALYLVWRRRTG